MIGFKLEADGGWATVTPSASEPGRWRLTTWDGSEPTGHTVWDTAVDALLEAPAAMRMTRAIGDGAEALAAKVMSYRDAHDAWLDAVFHGPESALVDLWGAEPTRPAERGLGDEISVNRKRVTRALDAFTKALDQNEPAEAAHLAKRHIEVEFTFRGMPTGSQS